MFGCDFGVIVPLSRQPLLLPDTWFQLYRVDLSGLSRVLYIERKRGNLERNPSVQSSSELPHLELQGDHRADYV